LPRHRLRLKSWRSPVGLHDRASQSAVISTSLAPSSWMWSTTLKSGFISSPALATNARAAEAVLAASRFTRNGARAALEVGVVARRPRVGRTTYCCCWAADLRIAIPHTRNTWSEINGIGDAGTLSAGTDVAANRIRLLLAGELCTGQTARSQRCTWRRRPHRRDFTPVPQPGLR